MENQICKYYQLGYCKYKGSCRRNHDHEMCNNIEDCKDTNCTKRHPKPCKIFKEKGKCRFDVDCAYLHRSETNSQNKLNEILSQCMIKHEKEISDLQEKVNNLQEVIRIMTEKLNNLEHTPKTGNEKEKVKDAEDSEKVFKCKKCRYECKKEIFMIKHTNTKHPNEVKGQEEKESSDKEKKKKFYCDQCDFCCTTKKSLKRHMTEGHKYLNPLSHKTCNQCDFKYVGEEDIEEHMNVNHPNDLEESTSDYHEAPEVDEAELDEWIAKAKAAEN